MNPVAAPHYRTAPADADLDLAVEVESSDWPGLLSAATLALSDLLRPLGRFDTWTARRVTARGTTPATVLEGWLGEVLEDHRDSGFLPALVEVEQVNCGGAHGVHRGGWEGREGREGRLTATLRPGSTTVLAGERDLPWRARFVVRRGA